MCGLLFDGNTPSESVMQFDIKLLGGGKNLMFENENLKLPEKCNIGLQSYVIVFLCTAGPIISNPP